MEIEVNIFTICLYFSFINMVLLKMQLKWSQLIRCKIQLKFKDHVLQVITSHTDRLKNEKLSETL